MLTKSDIEAIGKLLDEKLEKQNNEFDKKLAKLRTGINNDLIETLIEPLNMLGEHDTRIEKIEKHLDLPAA